MTESETREQYRRVIQDELGEFVMHDLGCAMVTPSMNVWRRSPLGDIGFRFGWAPPFPVDEGGLMLIVSVCPELIAAITEHLDLDAVHTYLDVVKQLIDELVTAPERDPEEVIRETENLIYEMDPAAIKLASSIEARAIDLGLTERASST